ncbi:MAG: xanthine dehydrogenase accessory protein XdhC [Pseudomonadota bacterium]
MLAGRLTSWLEAGAAVALVEIASVQGSAPRGVGAAMIVRESGVHGTIGGGALEALAIESARAMLSAGEDERSIDQPLGPDLGQCCGGRVVLSLRRATVADAEAITAVESNELAARPNVLIFGAGHVGGALARALAALPLALTVVDSRSDWLLPLGEIARIVETPLPEAEVAAAPAGSAFVILTYDHATDFLIAEAALARGDAAYVGMIGSASKRAALAGRLRGAELSPDALICPIGAEGPDNDLPEVIALAAAAEISAALL